MKLRTEMVGNQIMPSRHNGYDVEHDLLVAHALVQTMEEWGHSNLGPEQHSDWPWIRLAAQVRMERWGYEA
jgi:hypothetical protein